MQPRKHAKGGQNKKSLTQQVNEGWEYFWRKRGLPRPPTHTNMIFDDFTSKKGEGTRKKI